MFQGSFQWVSRVIERSSKENLGKFKVCFKYISRKFQGCSKKEFRVSGFQGCLTEALGGFEESFKGIG